MAGHRVRGALLALACLATAVPPAAGAEAPYDPSALSIGNRVFFDDNDNGRLDAPERGVAGWSVRLLGADSAPIATQVTNATGHYRFDGLSAGVYSVEVLVPTGYRSSTDLPTSADPGVGVDSDDNGIGALGGAVRSGALALGTVAAPVGELDLAEGAQPGPDDRTDLSVDFGIVRMAVLPIFFVVPPVVAPPVPTAELSLSASAPQSAVPGQIVDYSLTLRNTSSVAARNVAISLQAPLGVSVVQTVRVSNARRVRQHLILGTLPARSSRRLRLRLRFITVRPGMRMTIDASVTARNATTDTAAATVRVLRRPTTPTRPPSTPLGEL